jgi:alkylation response protein AidB-like acyl-CoA dehydrogenase
MVPESTGWIWRRFNRKDGNMRQPLLKELVSEEDRLIQQAVRAFVDSEIMPVRQQLDDDKDHILIDKISDKLKDLGFQRAMLPERYSGLPQRSMVGNCIVLEEIARGDVGLAVSLGCTGWCIIPATVANNEAVLGKVAAVFCGDELRRGCFAMTEPDGGCDIENPALRGKRISTRAMLDGDEWVLNGSKRFPSNAGISAYYCVVCTTDPNLGDEGIALIYVPHPSEGLSFGKFENKAGMQADRNCDIYLDNVRVPRENRAAGPGEDAKLLEIILAIGRIASGAMAVGAAQGTFETVLEYTKNRIVAGKPIREHSICAGMLADMAIGIETARMYYLTAAYMFDRPETYGPRESPGQLSRGSIAKVYGTEVAIMVTNKAMELMGSYGYMREYDVEKYWRDCKEIQLWEGGAQLGRFDVVRGYYDFQMGDR